ISQLFTSLDSILSLHQRKYNFLMNIKSTLLSKMFPDQNSKFPNIRFSEFTHAWEQDLLGELGKFYSGLSGKTKEDFGIGNAKYIDYLNILNNTFINLNELKSTKEDEKQNLVKKGDIFFTISSETPEEVAMSSVILENVENTYLNSFSTGFRFNENFKNIIEFFGFYFRSKNFRDKVLLLAQGISRFNISKTGLKNLQLTFPPSLPEQQKISQLFTSLDSILSLHQRQLQIIKNIKKKLLERMFI
ncbi:restriction endonuclease subunit S, partial [Mycoplasma sp. 4013]